jgi:prephenate dehydrogenase
MIISIIGVGLLGGSFALSLREKYPHMKFVGVDHSIVNQKIALAKGIIDEIMTLEGFAGSRTEYTGNTG